MLSYYCPECLVNWAPYQAAKGCPFCGSGTRRVNQPATKGIVEFYKAIVVTQAKHDRFDEFVADRERAELEAILRMPTLDPEA